MPMSIQQQSKPHKIGNATITVAQDNDKVTVSAAGPHDECREVMIGIGQKIAALDPDQRVSMGTGTAITVTLNNAYETTPAGGIEHMTYESIVGVVASAAANVQHKSAWQQLLDKANLLKDPHGRGGRA